MRKRYASQYTNFGSLQLRGQLNDKKTTKATTVQTIELTPDFMLDNTQSFLYGYRNVLVVKK